MITEILVERQDLCNEELAIRLYDLLHKKDIRRQTTLQWPIANKLGINQALLLEIVHNWAEYNAYKGVVSYFHDDEWWTSDTYDNWLASYPAFGSMRTLQRIFKELEESDYIISCRPFGKGKNGTKFYRVNKAKVGILLMDDSPFCHVQESEKRQNGASDLPNRQVGSDNLADPTIYINNLKKEEKINGDFIAKAHDNGDTKQIPLVEILQFDTHPINQMEANFKIGADEEYYRQQAAIIWEANRPGNFASLSNGRIDSHSWSTFKRNYLIEQGAEALTLLRESLIYAREYDDTKEKSRFSWRDPSVRFTFGEWVKVNLYSGSEKIINLSTKHRFSMEQDRNYADRVNGISYSMNIPGVPLDQRSQADSMLEAMRLRAEGENIVREAEESAKAARKWREEQEELKKLTSGGISCNS